MDTDQVVRQHRSKDVSRPGQNGKDVGSREGNVKEKTQLASPSQASELIANEEQVVVVNPDEIVVVKHGRQGGCVPSIYAPVRPVSVRTYPCALNEAVKDWPESAVGEAVVEEIDFVGGKIDGGQIHRAGGVSNFRRGPRSTRDGPPAPANPHTASLDQGRAHRADKSANCARPSARRVQVRSRRDPVRNHYEPSHGRMVIGA